MRFTTFLLTFVLFSSTTLQSAPIPKRQEQIDTEFLNDTTWKYHYGCHKNGKIWFRKDGTYQAYHNSTLHYVGFWHVNRFGVICLQEFSFNMEKQTVSPCSCKYYMKITTKNFPTLTGIMVSNEETNIGSFLELSNRIKFNNEEEND
jgi:hypothetical protein